MNSENPILKDSGAPFGAPNFGIIEKVHFLPAFREGIALAKAEIDAITSDSREPDFENTIAALEYSGEALHKVQALFFNLLEAESDEQMQSIAEEVSPMLTEYEMYVSLNAELFERVRAVYERIGELNLEPEQKRLTERTYKEFARNGAALSYEDKQLYGKLCEELSLLELKFGNNLLAATHAFSLELDNEEDLCGLPAYVVDMGASEAKEKGKGGWVFTLDYPSWSAFMKFSDRRELREKMWMAYNTRSVGGPFDNTEIVRRIAELRIKIASILSYPTYADYVLENRMAGSRETVEDFLKGLMLPSLPAARREVAEILEFASGNGFGEEELQPWDFSYWTEKYRESRFDLNAEKLKPYFRLENCVDAVFGLANRLYGLSFEEWDDVPVYHKDVKVYEVKDEDGVHLALFYADFYPRQSKRGGAWMTEFRGQYARGGHDFRPFVSIVTNFSKPTVTSPSLLTHDELTTLLHEFGHALHGILSKGRYPSMCGTNVARDFVELPSQIMENWAFEPEFLDTFAKHYVTGESIPKDYVERIARARNFLAGYSQVRQLQFGIIDMAWHTLSELPEEGAAEFERRVLEPFRTLPYVGGTAVCPSFGHIFSGGYSAGYYSYKWAEVLEADAFSMFEEKGLFSREVAGLLRKNILERGSSEDESALYLKFRGHRPDPGALLRKLGIGEPSACQDL